MLLSQTKEREYRFKLALRIGLPIFALIVAFILHTLVDNHATLETSFYIESIVLLVFSIYFILHLINHGFTVKITDGVSKAFTREYFYNYISKELTKDDDYTLILISIDNLHSINTQYGIKNGDRVLQSVAVWIEEYLNSKKIHNFPLGHVKGGDFILGLRGSSDKYATLLELMCLKSNELKVDDIEIKISGSISDTTYSKDLDFMVEKLFELHEERRSQKPAHTSENINPNELELSVIQAIENRDLTIMTQDIYSDGKAMFAECFVKLKTDSGKILYPKSYMKVINRLGLSVEYDLMLLEEITLKSINSEIIYAIHISPSSLRNEKFLGEAQELLKSVQQKVVFILNEAEYYSHTSRYNVIINRLHNHNVLIAIDRLGSIHTSFLYLRELNIDIVRFDSYYSNSEKLLENKEIVDGFNIMAHKKNIKTWIKNVENIESHNLIKDLDIDYVQGRFFGEMKPF